MNKVRYVSIDGYNIINAWNKLKVLKDESLEDAVINAVEHSNTLKKLEKMRRNL